MRRLRYNVAVSLDGFIAPKDESTGWIVEDQSIDFQALYSSFDVFIMGRKTYEIILATGEDNLLKGRSKDSIVVISRSLKQSDHPEVTIEQDNYLDRIRQFKRQNGRDIWLMGGGWLATACLDAGLLDSIEAAIMPVVLRSGFKLLTEPYGNDTGGYTLKLTGAEKLENTGILMTRYDIEYC